MILHITIPTYFDHSGPLDKTMRHPTVFRPSTLLQDMESQQQADPCPHLPYANTPYDPDDPFANLPDPGLGKTWQQFPWNESFISDPKWYDAVGRDMIVQKRIFMLKSDDEQITETLKVLEVFPNRGLDVMFKAAVQGKPHIIRALLARGVKAHPVDEDGDDDSLVPLHAAAFRGHLECVKLLVEQGNVDPDLCDVTSTPLQRAALGGRTNVVEYLLATGKVNIRRQFVYDGHTRHPLEWIVRSEKTQTANVLIDALMADASPDSAALNVPDVALTAAACAGNVAILRRLFEIREILPRDAAASQKPRALSPRDPDMVVIEKCIGVAAKQAKIEALRFLLDFTPQPISARIAESELIRGFFENGLLQAVKEDSIVAFDFIASCLFRDGVDFGAPGAQEIMQRCLFDAVSGGSLPMVKHLVQTCGVDVNDGSYNPQNITPIGVASARSDGPIVRYLLEEAPVKSDLTLGAGTTNIRPLWYAVKQQKLPIIRLLLQHGGPIDFVPPRRRHDTPPTPIRIAACLDPERQVRIYLDQHEWDQTPDQDIRASLDLTREEEEIKAMIVDIMKMF